MTPRNDNFSFDIEILSSVWSQSIHKYYNLKDTRGPLVRIPHQFWMSRTKDKWRMRLLQLPLRHTCLWFLDNLPATAPQIERPTETQEGRTSRVFRVALLLHIPSPLDPYKTGNRSTPGTVKSVPDTTSPRELCDLMYTHWFTACPSDNTLDGVKHTCGLWIMQPLF